MPKKFKSVHALLTGKLLMQDKLALQTQRLLVAANHPLERANRLYEVIIKLPVIPSILTQTFYTAIQQADVANIGLLTAQIKSIIKQHTPVKNELQGTPYDTYAQAFFELTSHFQHKVDMVNKHYEVFLIYHLSADLIISCPTYKNVLFVQLVENEGDPIPYKVKFTFNDVEKSNFSFNQQHKENDVWVELGYSTGNTCFNTQQLVEYWIARLYEQKCKV
jgi:hypothetical protein